MWEELDAHSHISFMSPLWMARGETLLHRTMMKFPQNDLNGWLVNNSSTRKTRRSSGNFEKWPNDSCSWNVQSKCCSEMDFFSSSEMSLTSILFEDRVTIFLCLSFSTRMKLDSNTLWIIIYDCEARETIAWVFCCLESHHLSSEIYHRPNYFSGTWIIFSFSLEIWTSQIWILRTFEAKFQITNPFKFPRGHCDRKKWVYLF